MTMQHHFRIVLLVILTQFFAIQALAQQRIETQRIPDIEIDFFGFEKELQLTDEKTVTLGDPALGEWAIKQIDRFPRMEQQEALAWLQIVTYYRISEAERELLKAIGELKDSDNTLRWPYVRNLFVATARVATPRSRIKIKRQLKKFEGLSAEDLGRWSRPAAPFTTPRFRSTSMNLD